MNKTKFELLEKQAGWLEDHRMWELDQIDSAELIKDRLKRFKELKNKTIIKSVA
ncbi:MAG TPA: hypothetical protein VF974_04945 [Patescibacteria group bacterium]